MQRSEIVKDLLDIGAIQIKTDDYFTWSSGIRSPVYCDNRLIMSHPSIREKVTNHFTVAIESMDVRPDIIAGCATAGIPHAAWLCDRLRAPMLYVRSKPKQHGKGNQIEGAHRKGQNVLVIEDLISTGMSSIETANALRQEGLNVLSVSAIFTYGLKQADKHFQKEDLSYQTIITFDDVLDHLSETGTISKDEENVLLNWRNNL